MHALLHLRLCHSRAAIVKEAVVEDSASILIHALLIKLDVDRRMAVVVSVLLHSMVSYGPFFLLSRALLPVLGLELLRLPLALDSPVGNFNLLLRLDFLGREGSQAFGTAVEEVEPLMQQV